MLIAKGYEISLKLLDGKVIQPPARYALLHDTRGYDWPADSCLISPFQKTGGMIREKEEARKYFGYDPRAGKLEMPTRRLNQWEDIGECTDIDYYRPGADDSTRGDFWHPFSKTRGWWIFSSGGYPSVYRLGQFLRIELGSGSIWNERGFVSP